MHPGAAPDPTVARQSLDGSPLNIRLIHGLGQQVTCMMIPGPLPLTRLLLSTLSFGVDCLNRWQHTPLEDCFVDCTA